MDWRSMNGIRSSSRALSFLRRTLIIASHASFAPFVPYERLIFFLSGHAIKISQQSHKSAPTAGLVNLLKFIIEPLHSWLDAYEGIAAALSRVWRRIRESRGPALLQQHRRVRAPPAASLVA